MSRIGRQPIEVPAGVTVTVDPGRVTVHGPKGELRAQVPLRMEIARILKEEGYVREYRVEQDARPYKVLVIELKYGRGRERVLTGLKRISKPGRRIYAGKDALPRVLGGMGTAILSTSRGVITSRTAEREGVGGEVICFVW